MREFEFCDQIGKRRDPILTLFETITPVLQFIILFIIARILSPSVFTDLSAQVVPEEPFPQRETSSWLTSLSPFWNGEENERIEEPTSWYGFYGRKKRATKS